MAPKRATASKAAPAAPRRSSRLASRESSKEPESQSQHPVTNVTEDSAPLPAITEVKPAPKAKQPKETGTAHTAEDILRNLLNQAAKKDKNQRSLKIAVKKLGLTDELQGAVVLLTQQPLDLQEMKEDLEGQLDSMTAEKDYWRKRSNQSLRRQGFFKKLEKYGPAPADPSPPPAPLQEESPVADSTSTTAANTAETEQIHPVENSTVEPEASASTAAAPVGSPRVELPPLTPMAPVTSPTANAPPASEPARPAARPAESPWRRFMPDRWVPGLRRQRPEDAATATPATAVSAVEQPERGIKRPHSTGKMRSVKDPQVPTSLSTVTEYTEPPSFMESVPDTTPSKRRRIESTPLMDASMSSSIPPLNTPYVTAAPMTSSPFGASAVQSSTPYDTTSAPMNTSLATSSTPKRTSTTTKLKRTPAAVRRAQRERNQASMQPQVPYAWERDLAKPPPKEKNADVRLAKMRNLEYFRAQVKELEADPDVVDIEGHSAIKRKRVKVDHLAVIPHNRPGDSSSTFRVPDFDSDSEMSVDEDVEEMTNVFEESEATGMEGAGEKEASKEAGAKEAGPMEAVKEVEVNENANEAVGKDQMAVPEKWVFDFPEVGARDPNHHMSEEESALASWKFEQGLAEFLAAGGH